MKMYFPYLIVYAESMKCQIYVSNKFDILFLPIVVVQHLLAKSLVLSRSRIAFASFLALF